MSKRFVADPVSMKSHGDTAVRVPGMDIVLRQMEIIADHRSERVICLPVGRIRAAIGKGQEPLTGKRIGQKRGVMPLHG